MTFCWHLFYFSSSCPPDVWFFLRSLLLPFPGHDFTWEVLIICKWEGISWVVKDNDCGLETWFLSLLHSFQSHSLALVLKQMQTAPHVQFLQHNESLFGLVSKTLQSQWLCKAAALMWWLVHPGRFGLMAAPSGHVCPVNREKEQHWGPHVPALQCVIPGISHYLKSQSGWHTDPRNPLWHCKMDMVTIVLHIQKEVIEILVTIAINS